METFAEPSASPAQKLRGTFLDRPAAAPANAVPQTGTALPYAPVASASARGARPPINLRMILFAAIVLGLLGWPIYTLTHELVTHGISQHGDHLTVDLKSMGNFNMPVDGSINDVPAEFRALDGKRVELVGFMYQGNDASNHAKQFDFVYNVTMCCFNGPPKVQERVFATVPPGRNIRTYDMYTPARIVGTLHVNVKKSMGQVASVYTMDVEQSEMVN